MPDAPRNLIVSRSQPGIWDRQSLSATINAYDRERLIAAAWGTGLAMLGTRQRGFTGGLLATLGTTIVIRAAMGRHDLAVGRHLLDRALHAYGWRSTDIVHDASAESFPASDAPSWTPTSGTGRR